MNFYKTVGSMYGSPDVRQLYAEISEVEEEHVSQYESLMDPAETWLERWVLHEFGEVANYYTCYETEVDPRIKQVWEMFLAYELEHLRIAGEALKRMEGVDPEALCGTTLPTPATFETNRAYVTDVLKATADMRLVQGGELVKIDQLPSDWPSRIYQGMVNADGAPSETIVQLRIDAAGGELVRVGDKSLAPQAPKYRRETLDGADAPNTAASGSTYDEQAEIQRLGELAPWVDDVKANANGGASRRNGAGKANGRTREKTAPRRSRS
jgi:hypothetical protein